MTTTARLGLALALATALMVLSSATASGKTWTTTYFCTNAKPKVVREIKAKKATSSRRLCVKVGMRGGKLPPENTWDPSWPIEGPDWPESLPGYEPPTPDV